MDHIFQLVVMLFVVLGCPWSLGEESDSGNETRVRSLHVVTTSRITHKQLVCMLMLCRADVSPDIKTSGDGNSTVIFSVEQLPARSFRAIQRPLHLLLLLLLILIYLRTSLLPFVVLRSFRNVSPNGDGIGNSLPPLLPSPPSFLPFSTYTFCLD